MAQTQPFPEWWYCLNQDLADYGLADAPSEEALLHYATGAAPIDAARAIAKGTSGPVWMGEDI